MVAASMLVTERPATAYSVLTHEGTVDALWDAEIVPLLRQRFPRLTAADLVDARSYAYGGSLIQDLGYYPFGSHLFTNLTHYVRTGDFVEALIRDAADVNEFAFALGALAHYASDNTGHPLAVNRAVPIMYPKVRAKVGNEALYVDSPAQHVMVEFAFDVLQVGRGGYVAQAYRDRVGFQVARPLLERAVRETYALELDDLLMNVDLAIGSYRNAVGKTIPELTRIAWRDKRKEIERANPGITEQQFVLPFSRQEYERNFGTKYQKPGFFARVLAVIFKIVPKVGPFRPLAFEPLNDDAERLYLESVSASRTRYRTALQSLRARRLDLPNTDFDTGRPPVLGANRLADETHADLLRKLADKSETGVSVALQRQLAAFFADTTARHAHFKRKEAARIDGDLARLSQP
jgi:Zinc dependent phospholipase C